MLHALPHLDAPGGRALAYLYSKVEQVQVPVLSGDAIFVDNGHGDGREAVGQNGDAGAVLGLCDAGNERGRVGGQLVRWVPGEERILLLLERVAAVGHADRKVIASLVGSH